MFRFFVSLFLLLTLLLALFTATSAALGSLQPNHPVSGQIAWCADDLICWMGIDTTQTTTYDARAILEQAGYQRLPDRPDYYRLDSEPITCVARLLPIVATPANLGAIGVECEGLRLSEVMDVLGSPNRVGYSCDGTYIFYYGRNFYLTISDTLSPNQHVELMVFSHILVNVYQQRWYGFALPWRYIDRRC